MNRTTTIMTAVVLCLTASMACAADGFSPLFDGKTLDGWQALPGGEWKVVDGSIVGTSVKSDPIHGMLLSKKQYGDFVVRLKYKALAGNSGLYFRVQRIDHPVSVKGFQAEIDGSGKDIGGLYETLGRAWVVKPTAEQVAKFYKLHDWNEMTVAAVGGNVTVMVNGTVTARLVDDPAPRKGHFGLQLHGGQDMNVMFKDVAIREIKDPARPVILHGIHDLTRPRPQAAKPKTAAELSKSSKPPQGAVVLFDGSSLDAWQPGQWRIKDGLLQTAKGDLLTKQGFGDCKLHVEWRIVDPNSHGNSGVYLMNQYEVQVFNSHDNHSPIYADGQAASIYGQYPPLVNACRPSGEWEVFDIDFRARVSTRTEGSRRPQRSPSTTTECSSRTT